MQKGNIFFQPLVAKGKKCCIFVADKNNRLMSKTFKKSGASSRESVSTLAAVYEFGSVRTCAGLFLWH